MRLTPPTEFIVSKAFIQDRYRYDGADVAHTILKMHDLRALSSVARPLVVDTICAPGALNPV